MNEKLTNEIAKRLKAARKTAGFKSAKDFSVKHAIPLSTYSQHETGKRSISAELIVTYSEKLEISPCWLLIGQGNPFVVEPSNQEREEAIKHELFSISKDLPKDSMHYSSVDTATLKKILLLAEPLFHDESVILSYAELVDYCLDVYNIVSSIKTANTLEKDKIINLTISSLKRGAISHIKTLKNNISKP